MLLPGAWWQNVALFSLIYRRKGNQVCPFREGQDQIYNNTFLTWLSSVKPNSAAICFRL